MEGGRARKELKLTIEAKLHNQAKIKREGGRVDRGRVGGWKGGRDRGRDGRRPGGKEGGRE